MKHSILLFIFILCAATVKAQKVYTKNGSVSFFSSSPLEDITAKNNEVMSVLNQHTGDIQFSILIKSFRFKKSLMQQHFNEDYLESDQYPKAIFKGRIDDLLKVNFTKDGEYTATVSGDMTLHGVTKKQTATGKIIIENGLVTAQSNFSLLLSEYKIAIPAIVKNNISKTIAITLSCRYDKKL